MPRTRIKVCGIRSLEIALAAVEAGADALGFMFVKSSVRSIDPDAAAEIMWALPPMVTTVGVFMNASVDTFSDFEEACPTHYAQLHGNEDEATVKACGPAIKTVRFDRATIGRELDRWSAVEEVDAILVDVATPPDGSAPDWAGLAAAAERCTTPIILSGHLTAQTVAPAIRAVRPYAVDVSAGVEVEPGVKDPSLIEAFCRAVAAADRD
ncbi:MAG: phosphoribosylanthranilate isomerase [Phycisphaeraceae bacterium]|nr:phosphoribosylanthranilate isomerase [Phycisphaeraceae bacterium]